MQTARQQVDELTSLKKMLLRIQTYTDANKLRNEYLGIVNQLEKINAQSSKLWNFEPGGPEGFSEKINFMGQSLSVIRNNIKSEINQYESGQFNTLKISQSALDLASLIQDYINSVDTQLIVFDNDLKARLSTFRIYEIIILIVTLLLLLLEALFIFSPALKKLDAALKARSSFLSRIGHEIRNPINSILGMTEMIENNTTEKAQLMYLSRLKKSANGLLNFLNNVIDYAGIENNKTVIQNSPCYIHEIVEEISALFHLDAAKKNIQLYFFISPNFPRKIISDEIKLKYILINLLNNAIKFTEQGSIKIYLSFQNDLLNILVKDTGIGIAQEKQGDIFKEFVQEDSSTKRKYGGTGLGLSITYEYIKKLNGDIFLKSQKGEGSEFSVSLPAETSDDSPTWSLENLTNKSIHIVGSTDTFEWFEFHEFENINYYEEINQLPLNLSKQYFDSVIILPNLSEVSEINLDNEIYFTNNFESKKKHVDKYLFPLTPWNLLARKNNTPSVFNQELKKNKSQDSVMICDDNFDNRDILNNFLSPYFSKITIVSKGQDCINLMNKESFSYLFLDIQMPELDGYEVLEQLKKIPNIKTIFIAYTAHNTGQELDDMMKAGFHYILNKPTTNDSIIRLMKKLQHQSIDRPSFEQRVQEKILKKRDHYIQRVSEQCESLLNTKSDMDTELLNTFGHQLKGTGATFNLVELSRLGAELEVLSKQSDKEKCLEILNQINVILINLHQK